MKNVSRQYKKSMSNLLRERGHCSITFGNSDITAITDGTWSGDAESISDYSTLDYSHNFGNTIATLELNRWVLNGTNDVKRENDGFIGDSFTDCDLIKTFTIDHAFSGLTLSFDTRENSYPFKVRATLYDSDNDELESVTSFPSDTTLTIPVQSTEIRKVKVEILSTLPSHRGRVESVAWGSSVAFSDDDLLSVKQAHDVDPLSRRLPSEKLSFVITDPNHVYDPDNPTGAYAYITKGTNLSVTFGYEVDGTTEWVKADNYSLSDIPSFKNEKVTFSGTGLIQTLTNEYYKDTWNASGKTLYALATAVLTDAGLPQTAEGENPWDIDTSLQNMTTTAILPIDTHANLLQMIAHASRCRFYTDDDNIIHIKPFGVTPIGIFNGTYADNGHTAYSNWKSVDYGNPNVQDTATLELNRWTLDGTSSVDRVDNGFVSSLLAGTDGDNTCYFTKKFDVAHDLPLFTIVFDSVQGEYPYKVTVGYYDADDTLITSNTVYPTDEEVTIETEDVEDCTWIKVECLSSLPQTRVRVNSMSFRETDFSLTLDSIKDNTLVTSKLDKLKDVQVTEYTYYPKEDTSAYDSSVDVSSLPTSVVYEVSKLYEGDTTLTSLHLEYSPATDITVQVTGGTITSQNVYAQACDLVLSSGTKHVLVTGTPIETGEKVHTYSVNATGEDDVEENMLITSTAMADALASHVEEYLTLRNTYDASYRGNPELETGDIIKLETLYSDVVYGIMLTDEIDYNGSFSGKVKVKGLC